MLLRRRDAPPWAVPPFLFYIALLAVALIGFGCRRAAPPEPTGEDITLAAADESRVSATLSEPPSPQGGLVLVHGYNSDRFRWNEFAAQARAEGFATIAVDLRPPSETEETRARQLSPWVLSGYDIEAAHKALVEAGVPTERVAFVGADIGGTIALRYAAQSGEVPAIVLVSPGLAYEDLEIEEARAAFGGAVMTVYATGDAYASTTARAIYDLAPGLSEVREYQGTAQGMDLLDASHNARIQILHWIEVALGIESEVPVAETDYVPEWARKKK